MIVDGLEGLSQRGQIKHFFNANDEKEKLLSWTTQLNEEKMTLLVSLMSRCTLTNSDFSFNRPVNYQSCATNSGKASKLGDG